MKNNKSWLFIKAGLIILFTVFIFAVPTEDAFRKWFRFIMLSLFVFSFIVDVIRYKKYNG
ncbi:MAG: hypothetical protein IPL50_21005 [Chitinophagaceae bacterium]|nr:hypothetical protein [Chitinophagaceae bacterium]